MARVIDGTRESSTPDETPQGLFADAPEDDGGTERNDFVKAPAFLYQTLTNYTPEGAGALWAIRSLQERTYPPTPGFDPWKEELPPDLEGDRGRFSDVRSPERFQARVDQIRQDRADARILGDHPVLGLGASLAMGGLSPTSLVSVGAKSALGARAAAGIGAAVNVAGEVGRQAAQGALDPLALLGTVGGSALHAVGAARGAFRDADPAAVGAAGRAADAVHASAEADAAALARAAEERAAGGSPGAVARGPMPFALDEDGNVVDIPSGPVPGARVEVGGRTQPVIDADAEVPSGPHPRNAGPASGELPPGYDWTEGPRGTRTVRTINGQILSQGDHPDAARLLLSEAWDHYGGQQAAAAERGWSPTHLNERQGGTPVQVSVEDGRLVQETVDGQRLAWTIPEGETAGGMLAKNRIVPLGGRQGAPEAGTGATTTPPSPLEAPAVPPMPGGDRRLEGLIDPAHPVNVALRQAGAAADGPVDARELLRIVAEGDTPLAPVARLLADRLAGPVPVHFRPEPTSPGGAVRGRYFPVEHKIELFGHGVDQFTLVHEAVHASTVAALHEYSSLRLRFEGMLDAARTHAGGGRRLSDEEVAALHDRGVGSAYGMTNVQEFVAEAFSNPRFQGFLRSIPGDATAGVAAPKRSLWQSFKAAVLRAVGLGREAGRGGLPPEGSSLLDAVLDHGTTGALMGRDAELRAGGWADGFRPAPEEGSPPEEPPAGEDFPDAPFSRLPPARPAPKYRDSDERLVPMGGMENLGLTPFLRLMTGPVLSLLPDVAALVSHPFAQVKNLLGLASEISVEQRARKWSMDAANTSLETEKAWLEYRGANASAPMREGARIAAEDAAAKLVGGEPGLSFKAFREAVGDAMNDGDRHDIPQVAAAAQKWRALFDRLKAEGSEAGVYAEGAKRQGAMVAAHIRALEDRIKELDGQVSRGEAPPGWQRYVREIDQTLERLKARKEILAGQPDGDMGVGTGRSYFPQMLRIDRALAEPEAFKDLLRRGLRRGMLPRARGFEEGAERPLERVVDEVWTELTQRGDWRPLNDDPDVVGLASAARERTLQWPKDLWDEAKRFYEHDVDLVGRHHARTLGTDVELMKRYGSVEMHDQLGQIDDWAAAEARRRLGLEPGQATPDEAAKGMGPAVNAKPLTAAQRASLDEIGARARSMKDDLRSLRDKVRGTYGLPSDPYRWQSRTIRAAKQFNNLTKMGLATFSAFADAGRPIMVEGLDRTFRAGIVPLWNAIEATALRRPGSTTLGLWAREARLAHAATEAMTGRLAMRFSDPADSFGRRSSWERMMARGNAAAFMASGIDTWTQHIKEWAGMIAGSRMLDDIKSMGAGAQLSVKKMQALARVGIGESEARQIAEHLDKFGERGPEGLWLPNTERWVGADGHLDTQSVWAFRHALANEVDRTIVTPSAADRPNWMSTEMGGLIGQYRTFGLSNFQRILMAGMQDPDKGSFVHGAVAMVGLGMIADRLRELAKGEDRRKPYMQRLADGVDRSGVLGFVSDLNNLVEAGTGNRFGLRPLVGAEKPYKAGWPYTLGQVGGPTVGTAFDVGQVVKGAFTPGHVDGRTAHALRNMLAGNNNVFLYRQFNGLQRELTSHNGARARFPARPSSLRSEAPPPEDPGLPVGTGA